jgi:predicted flavoprotein YhiN
LTKEERHKIILGLKEFHLTLTKTRGFKEAIVTQGGISVKEVNPSTMEAKNLPGLFICGEVLDVDAFTGGFNLQIAFSTGYLAGISIS